MAQGLLPAENKPYQGLLDVLTDIGETSWMSDAQYIQHKQQQQASKLQDEKMQWKREDRESAKEAKKAKIKKAEAAAKDFRENVLPTLPGDVRAMIGNNPKLAEPYLKQLMASKFKDARTTSEKEFERAERDPRYALWKRQQDAAKATKIDVSPVIGAKGYSVKTMAGQDVEVPKGMYHTGEFNNAGIPIFAPLPGTKEKKVSDAGQQASIKLIDEDIKAIRKEVFTDEGEVDTANLAAGAFGVPFTEGRGTKQRVKRVVETKLRAATGAAAPDQEVKNYADMFSPTLGDTKGQIETKLKHMEDWSRMVLEGVDPAEAARRATQAEVELEQKVINWSDL